jgi:ATP-binding cassette, subfamily C, bacteriocin exporter
MTKLRLLLCLYFSVLTLALLTSYGNSQTLDSKKDPFSPIAEKSNYAIVLQKDDYDCSAAVLATIALHYHKPYDYQQIRNSLAINENGANLLSIVKTADKLGFRTRAVKVINNRALLSITLPAIAHAKGKIGHFVVIHYVDKNSIIMADPATGIQKKSWKEFFKIWSGYLVLVEPK